MISHVLTVVIVLLLAVWMFFALRYLWKNRKRGGCASCGNCGGNCAACRGCSRGK